MRGMLWFSLFTVLRVGFTESFVTLLSEEISQNSQRELATLEQAGKGQMAGPPATLHWACWSSGGASAHPDFRWVLMPSSCLQNVTEGQ